MRPLAREYIELLAEKKLCNTISPEEQVLLEQWLNQEPTEHMSWNSTDADELALRERLLKRIKEEAGIQDLSTSKKSLSLFQHYKWAAAAAILLFITGSFCYFLFLKHEDTPPDVVNNKVLLKDKSPGHNGAILTLANGNKIVLDSTINGRIAMQGTIDLIKKKGQLAYEKKTISRSSINEARQESRVTYNTITTPRGRIFRIMLSDGSKVWLNAASSITYPTAFTGKERKVAITGEAYFEIAPDSKHPFIVLVDKAKITVLGTHFDVINYPDEKLIKTTLLEGLVSISHGKQQVIIRPGKQASFSTQSGPINVTTVDADQSIAWVEGKLSLNNLGVEAIMRKISRWYDVDVVFDGPVPNTHFWGLINRDVNLSEMLRVLRANGIEAYLRDNKVIVSHKH